MSCTLGCAVDDVCCRKSSSSKVLRCNVSSFFKALRPLTSCWESLYYWLHFLPLWHPLRLCCSPCKTLRLIRRHPWISHISHISLTMNLPKLRCRSGVMANNTAEIWTWKNANRLSNPLHEAVCRSASDSGERPRLTMSMFLIGSPVVSTMSSQRDYRSLLHFQLVTCRQIIMIVLLISAWHLVLSLLTAALYK